MSEGSLGVPFVLLATKACVEGRMCETEKGGAGGIDGLEVVVLVKR